MSMIQIILSPLFGCIIGFCLGLLGGGGSILTVPVLVYIIGQDVHSATGTSLAIVGASAMLGASAHKQKGSVDMKGGLLFGSASMTGAIPGAWINHLVEGRVIMLLFSLLMIVAGVRMIMRKPRHESKKSSTHGSASHGKELLGLIAIGFFVGSLTGFFGIGGGFLIVPALVLVGGFPPHKAVGTSLLIITMASFAGFLGHLGFGAVDFKVVSLFVLGAVFGVLYGTSLSSRISGDELSKAFGWFIAIVALFLFYNNFLIIK